MTAIGNIKTMLANESFGVLATNGDGKTYTSLISFVTNKEATFLAFATPIDTKKHEMIEKDENVSILIDNRSANLEDISQIIAINAIGRAHILKDADEIKKWSSIFIWKSSQIQLSKRLN